VDDAQMRNLYAQVRITCCGMFVYDRVWVMVQRWEITAMS
jgi:hypothetical protein